jgi:prepilin-type N-terminal cleavage/methylation domain-containing protein
VETRYDLAGVRSIGAWIGQGPGGRCAEGAPRLGSAFTLLELLVVISIIALLISILVPAMTGAKNEASAAKCLANLREISSATSQYMENDERRQIIWYHYPVDPRFGGSVRTCTPWVFGGFKAPNPNEDDSNVDSSLYPAQLRPLNGILAADVQGSLSPNIRGDDIIDVYKCSADRSNSTSIISEDITNVEEEGRSSWEANGSSYTLNTRWAQGYANANGGNFTLEDYLYGMPEDRIPFAQRLAPHLVGDGASRFIMWVEQGFYSATYRASPDLPNGAAPKRRGWHRKFSNWCVGFADGHALYGFYDTRLSNGGMGGTIWQPNFRPAM